MSNTTRRLDPRYAAAEFFWYFDDEGDIDMISHYAPSYKKFENKGTTDGAYGPRLKPQLYTVINLLKAFPNTRRAVICLWRAHDLTIAGTSLDVPCTLEHQFLIDDGKLNMITTMRSNDAWLGFPYDVFVNTCIQRAVADELGIETGWYHHQVGSMHLYEQNAVDASLALGEGCIGPRVFECYHSKITEDINYCLDIERQHRTAFDARMLLNVYPSVQGFMRDLLYCVVNPDRIESEVLKNAYYRRRRPSRKDDAVS